MSWVSEDNITVTTTYTYTEDNKPACVKVEYPLSYAESYEDEYSYDSNGNMTGYTRTYSDMRCESYTAKKITNNKYIFYDSNNKEFLTIIFDNSGFIVAYRYTLGYINEYDFETDENGKPVTFKFLDIRPSGSQRLIEYSVEFKDGENAVMRAKGEFANENEYYQVKFEKITVKG